MGPDETPVALEERSREADRLHSPSVARNSEPIRAVYERTMPVEGLVLEIASGTGQHAAALCTAFPALRWQPSDIDPASLRSIAAWADRGGGERVAPPLELDVTAPGWWQAVPAAPEGIVCINMIHIAPRSAAEGLFRGAGALLRPGSRLFLYGPFSRRGAMAPSNARFSESLRSRDPAWGVRDLDDYIQPLAAQFGLALEAVSEMPANNLAVIFEKG